MKRWATALAVALVLFILITAAPNDFVDHTANARHAWGLTPYAYLPYISSQSGVIYSSQNLSGHSIAAECNPGGVSQCPCSEADVGLATFAEYGEVTSNVREVNTYVNAIGYKKFTETFPDGDPITLDTYRYTGQFSLPRLPFPDPNQTENPEAAHLMIQLWDGRNALYQSNKTTLEGTIFWELNPWAADYGRIKVYTWPLQLVDTGITIPPDTQWHSFELIVDLASQRYVSIAVDGNSRDLSSTLLAQVYHPDWGDDVSFVITTESLASWPQNGCPNIFKWTTRFKNLVLSRLP